MRAGIFDRDHCRSRSHCRDLSLREVSLLLGGCLPRRRRERRCELQPPVAEGQPPHAALTQSGCQRCRKDQRKHLRNCVSPHGTASGARTNHRSHCPSTVSPHLADPAPGSSIRRTGPSGHQTIEAKTYGQNAPAAPKPRLSDRTTQPSTQPSTSAVIFGPGATKIIASSALLSAVSLARAQFSGKRVQPLFAGMATHSVLSLEAPASAAVSLALMAAGHPSGWPILRGGAQTLPDALARHLDRCGWSLWLSVKGMSNG